MGHAGALGLEAKRRGVDLIVCQSLKARLPAEKAKGRQSIVVEEPGVEAFRALGFQAVASDSAVDHAIEHVRYTVHASIETALAGGRSPSTRLRPS